MNNIKFVPFHIVRYIHDGIAHYLPARRRFGKCFFFKSNSWIFFFSMHTKIFILYLDNNIIFVHKASFQKSSLCFVGKSENYLSNLHGRMKFGWSFFTRSVFQLRHVCHFADFFLKGRQFFLLGVFLKSSSLPQLYGCKLWCNFFSLKIVQVIEHLFFRFSFFSFELSIFEIFWGKISLFIQNFFFSKNTIFSFFKNLNPS